MRRHRIEILHYFVPYLREIYLFGKTELFEQNLGPFSVLAAKKADQMVKNGIFW